MFNFLLRLNWVDIVIVILVVRICYISIKTGFVPEIFKLAGIICAIYLALHYYMSLGASLQKNSFASVVPPEYFDFICFLALAGLGYLIFFLLRGGLYRLMEVKTIPAVAKWGGIITGLLRCYFTVGLIVFAFSISTVRYFKDSGAKSYIGSRLSDVAPATYSWIWDNLASKLSPNEKVNSTVLKK